MNGRTGSGGGADDLREAAERIFLAALEEPAGERDAFISSSCRGDADLERTVRSLIEFHDRTGPFDRMRDEVSRWRGELLGNDTGETGGNEGSSTLAFGPVGGERYRIEGLLGRGGMGEVWRAYDLKLGIEVALKWLRSNLIGRGPTLELLRQEVRAAREVVSPNVCRVFDLHEVEGRELIAMEFVDGTTLRRILAQRAPLELDEAREIASQYLAGLQAIHDAGFVHRDIKPENLMITRTGRVVVMDFGIAQGLQDSRSGPIAGTLAYMPREQRSRAGLGPRTDLFAAGVVLAEMVEPSGVGSQQVREALWDRIHQPVPQISDTPWTRVIARAVAPEPEDRHESATAMAQALDQATLRAVGDEEVRPYPGLVSFTGEDAEFFFGRELEVEALWRRVEPARLLAVAGASGAGKSSFLQAGFLPSLPGGWSALTMTPGTRPFVAFARSVAEKLPSDPETVDSLLRFEEPAAAMALVAQWRELHDRCLVVVDQFEELFTQNPHEVQAAFAGLLSRLPLEVDVHVLVSMRDDFLLHCNAFEPLLPVFARLTPIGAPTGAALRRAIVEPARKCGYRFEDEALVEEMVSQVEGERGSLPLLAFAAEKLWELRDRERGLLTRETYQQIGGVAGALAQHAERTLGRIGEQRIPIVRELFRNLVTAQGTRATRTRHQLLSVFDVNAPGERETSSEPDAKAAAAVLDALTDARLLTSYEVPGAETDRRHRTEIEIVHESLLTSWPRLERWQAQEADSAQLRDQLRQAAQVWSERGRPDELLWSGTYYGEFKLWRERYPGGLSSEEEEFAAAMTTHAERRKRRRQALTASLIAVLTLGLFVVGVFWRQATVARDRSQHDALRAEANQLLALGRLALRDEPTATLPYALASLERVDSPEARRMAVEALWHGPSAFRIGDRPRGSAVAFSPDGRWLAAGFRQWNDQLVESLEIWSQEGERISIAEYPEVGYLNHLQFGPHSGTLLSVSRFPHKVAVWSIPQGELLQEIESDEPLDARLATSDGRIFVFAKRGDRVEVEVRQLGTGRSEAWVDLPGGLATWSTWANPWNLELDASGSRLFSVSSPGEKASHNIQLRHAEASRFGAAETVGVHPQEVTDLALHPDGHRVGSADSRGEARIWRLDGRTWTEERRFRHRSGLVRRIEFDRTGRFFAALNQSLGQLAIWRLDGPHSAEALLLRPGTGSSTVDLAFHPEGNWLTAGGGRGLMVFPVAHPYPFELLTPEAIATSAQFLDGGETLAVASTDGKLRFWSLSSRQARDGEVVSAPNIPVVEADPDGNRLLLSTAGGHVMVVPEGSGPLQLLDRIGQSAGILALRSRWAAVPDWRHEAGPSVIIWDVETGERRRLLSPDGAPAVDLAFLPDGSLVFADRNGIHIQEFASGVQRTVAESGGVFDLSADGRFLVAAEQGENDEPALYDLDLGTRLQLDRHGPTYDVAIDPSGRLVATVGEGEELRVGPATGETPHLLIGLTSTRSGPGINDSYRTLEFSPDGQWIATTRGDVVLWPVPDVYQTPLHALPYQEMLSKLRSLTNLRIVEDTESTTGWSLEANPFPGWETVPTW